MKLAVRIFTGILLISAIVFGIIKYIEYKENLDDHKYADSLFSNKTPMRKGFESFYNEQIKEDPNLTNKKYFYINIWEQKCKPCIKEMPHLDSLAEFLSPDIKCFFVTEQDNSIITKFLEKRDFHLKNFTIKNDLRNFCAGIFNETINGKRIYPMHVILDQTGKIIHFHHGAMFPNDIMLIHQFKKLGLLK